MVENYASVLLRSSIPLRSEYLAKTFVFGIKVLDPEKKMFGLGQKTVVPQPPFISHLFYEDFTSSYDQLQIVLLASGNVYGRSALVCFHIPLKFRIVKLLMQQNHLFHISIVFKCKYIKRLSVHKFICNKHGENSIKNVVCVY